MVLQMRLLPVLATALLLTGCSGDWGWYVVDPTSPAGQRNLMFLIDGLYYTIALSVTAILISVVVGLLIALPGLARARPPRIINRVYVELVRAVPILVLILWVYYGLPQVADIAISMFWAGVLALAISDSAFQAEIFRAGIQSIDRGQHEAAHSISLSYIDKMRFVILPQAIKRILPALGNQLVYMLKMSSLVSVIGMQELTRRANELVVTEYRPLEIYTVLVLEYL
jgi:polar amino acid transport system permease protein